MKLSGRAFRVAINTGGGDAPGLNAVIRAVVLASLRQGWEVFGVRNGYLGLLGMENGVIRMDATTVTGITHVGGTILGANNRGNPFRLHGEDHSQEVVAQFRARRFDALVAVGGDGSLAIARDLHSQYGLPVVGVPKTIDNDLECTDYTFGFDTAVNTATDALDKLHPTAQSHDRVMVVEVMGRHAGWIALHAGLAGTADVILVPEIPFEIDSVCRKIRDREASGRRFSIVVVAEGATPANGHAVVKIDPKSGAEARLGGIAEVLAHEIADRTGKETRSLVLGHLQRGGQPTALDRLLSLRFGTAAVRMVETGAFGRMVALKATGIVGVSLTAATQRMRQVPLDSDTVQTARDLGVCLGD